MTNIIRTCAIVLGTIAIAGCGSQARQDRDWFTSGNRDADQRAEQRMAKTNQERGEGTAKGQEVMKKKSLYDRLGADKGITAIVDDFVPRALADPRVNWERKDVKRGG